MRLLERIDLLRATARVLARPRDALFDRVSAPPDVVGLVFEIQRGGDGGDFVREQALVALHLGDAVFELGADIQRRAQFFQRPQRLLDRAEPRLATALAKPRS